MTAHRLTRIEKKIRVALTPFLADGVADGAAAVPSSLEQMPIFAAV